MIAPGQKLGRFELREPLGTGGMSAVYRAYDPLLDREVAIKILPPELAQDANLRERFHEEARALGRVEHPNLVRIYIVGQEGRISFYTMELIVGRSLRDALRAVGKLTVPEALAIIGQALRALDAVHRAGIVHRDIKPGNIMLDASGRVVLMDFGLARRAERQSLTAAGAVLGTPEYMSPEQARGDKADERSDLYSIGVVLYEMLAGRPPFSGKDTIAVLKQHVEAAVPPLRELAPGVPPELERIVLRLLAKMPEQRYSQTAELAADLAALSPDGLKPEKIVQELMARVARISGRPTRTAVVWPAEAPKGTPSAPGDRGERIRAWVALVSAFVAVVALLLAIAALMRGRTREQLAPVAPVAPPAAAPGTQLEVIRRGGARFVGELMDIRVDAHGESVWSFRLADGRVERVRASELRLVRRQKGGEMR